MTTTATGPSSAAGTPGPAGPAVPPGPPTALTRAAGGTATFVDERLISANFVRRTINKVFPDHWSFMIGEIALYTFVILLLTGTYLTFFYIPSLSEVTYEGAYLPLRGVEMTEAYASTLRLSFDVRGGLVIRQIHHWAALLFMASIVVHLMRVFFTGAFRKPREINWLIGVGLLTLGLLEGFAGYSLPDDLLSGTGLRIAHSIMLSIPVVGTYVAFLVFGGDYPGDVILGRLYIAHVFLLPGALTGLISVHMAILWFQKHTQFRGPGRTEDNVVGSRIFPVYAAKAGGFFFLVFGVLALLGGLAQINPIWLYGPYDPAVVSAGSQPDWYIGFLDGSTRLMPNWEFRGLGITLSPLFWPTVVLPGILFTLMAAYPFLEARFTGDRAHHNLLDRPRDRPVRTGIGVASIVFYIVLLFAGGNDLVAHQFDVSLNATTYFGRIACFVGPPLAYWVTYRICLGLQKRDQELLHHGLETGTIERLPSGEFIEVTAPVPVPGYIELVGVEPDHGAPGEGLEAGGRKDLTTGQRLKGFFYGDRQAIEAAADSEVAREHEPSGQQ